MSSKSLRPLREDPQVVHLMRAISKIIGMRIKTTTSFQEISWDLWAPEWMAVDFYLNVVVLAEDHLDL